MSQRLLNVNQLAKKFNINHNTVKAWIKEGKVQPHYYVQGNKNMVYLFREELDVPIKSRIKAALGHRQHKRWRSVDSVVDKSS